MLFIYILRQFFDDNLIALEVSDWNEKDRNIAKQLKRAFVLRLGGVGLLV